MSETSSQPAVPSGPVPVPDSVRGPYAPPPGQSPAYVPPTPAGTGPGRPPATAQTAGPGAIGRFAAPRRRTPLLLALLAGMAVAAVLLATGVIKVPVPAHPSPSASASPSPTITGRGTGFEMPNDPEARGSWEVVEQAWSDDGVQVHVRIYGLSGTVQYAFQAFPKGTSQPVKPTAGAARPPELQTGSVTAGQVAVGWLFLPLPREEATFFITTRTGRLLSAQPLAP